jgi:hypothetical protein
MKRQAIAAPARSTSPSAPRQIANNRNTQPSTRQVVMSAALAARRQQMAKRTVV